MVEYYYKDFESYSEIFLQHAKGMSKLMQILDEEIVNKGLPPVGRSKELFRMVQAITYHVNSAYKEKFDIEEDNEIRFTTYMSQDEILNVVKNTLKEEFNRFLESQNDFK